jgi:hypothetical protein
MNVNGYPCRVWVSVLVEELFEATRQKAPAMAQRSPWCVLMIGGLLRTVALRSADFNQAYALR